MAVENGNLANGHGHTDGVDNEHNAIPSYGGVDGAGQPNGYLHMNGNSIGRAEQLTNGHAQANDSSANGIATNGNGGISISNTNGEGPTDTPTPVVVEPMAICGMAMRLPGGIRNSADFWDLLVNKRSGRVKVPKSRYNVDSWYAPGKIGHVTSKYGYFLDDVELHNADASFWTMTQKEIEAMDPQQRMTLEMVYECLQNSGQKAEELRGKRVGIYLGTFEGDWLELDGRDPQHYHMYRLTGYGDYMSANRVHYEFGWTGPSVTIRTACSSSLTCLYDACGAISRGDCDSAVVACVNLIFSPRTTITMQEQGVMSPSGMCQTFDANADGYARGEACSAIYVKRLSDAIRDGDPIRSVIRSTAVNAGGRASTLTAPSTKAHEYLIRRGHAVAGLSDLSKTAMVECHGTGTSVGDPIEANAVANIFGEWGVYIGSVKTNLGHSEGASGLSSLIKMVLALEKRTIPPNINFKNPNPQIPFEAKKLTVPTEPMPWPSGKGEIVGVNSFGVGGSNAHVTMSSLAEMGIVLPRVKNGNEVDGQLHPRLLYFSAKHPEALKRMIDDHQAYLLSHADSLDDISYSLANRRDMLNHRAFVVADGEDLWKPTMALKPANRAPPRQVFVFCGQGAQYAQMGRTLFDQLPMFRHSISKMDEALKTCANPPKWTLAAEILRSKKTSRLAEAEFSQPCTTAIQIALVDTLSAYGIRAEAVVGHSSGEIAAAYAAGSITMSDAIIIAYQRGRVMGLMSSKTAGGMAAVGLGEEEVKTFLRPGVIIGCYNSPESCTLSGDEFVLNEILDDIQTARPGVLARALRVDRAYHSHHMQEAAQQYLESLPKNMRAETPTTPFYSSVRCEIVQSGSELGPSYWVENLVNPVRFSTAVAMILKESTIPNVFIEIGPHPALAGPLRQILRDADSKDDCISTLNRDQDAHVNLLETIGELWLRNAEFPSESAVPNGNFLTDLPLYPWHYDNSTTLWYESRLSRDWRQREHSHHELLGARVLESTDDQPMWRNILRLDQVKWIAEHEVGGDIVFPGVGYICMAAEAIRQISGTSEFTARQVHIKNALTMSEGVDSEVITQFSRASLTSTLFSEWYDFTIYSLDRSGSWIKHMFGQVRAGSEFSRKAPILEPLPRQLSRRAWYRKLKQQGLAYGPRFMGLRDMSAHPVRQEVLATLENDIQEGELYAVHPVTMDTWIQAMIPATFNGLTRKIATLGIPTYIEEVYVKPPKGTILVQATADEVPKSTLSGNVLAVSEGEVIGEMKGIQLSSIGEYEEEKEDPCAAVELEWKRDIDVIDASALMRPATDRHTLHAQLDSFAALCMIHADSITANTKSTRAHLQQYQTWLHGFVQSMPWDGFADRESLLKLHSTARQQEMDRLLLQLQDTDAAPAATAIHRISTNAASIFSGEVDELALLLEDDVLHRLYDFMQNTDIAELVELLAHRKPSMRILEIGAGTGGTTATLLPLLQSAYGERMYLSYTYTDISAGFFVAARERFAKYPAMEYQTLDISQDPLQQDFQEGTFDLVIACNVLHATPELQTTLRNVRKLMHPQGRLVLQELDPQTKWINLVMGVLPGWWLGEADDRPDEPYVSPSRWDRELHAAGFDGLDAVAYDGYLINNIISRPAMEHTQPKRISLLHSGGQPEHLKQMQRLLQDDQFEVDLCTIDTTPVPNQDIVAILDLAEPFVHGLDAHRFSELTAFIASMQNSGMLWVTGASQVNCTDPKYSMILGLARVLRTEMSLDFATHELDDFGLQGLQTVTKVLSQFTRRMTEADINPTTEWATVNGEVLVSRFHYIKVADELKAATSSNCQKKLEQKRQGMTDTLYWNELKDEITPRHGEVVVDMKAVGMNFKDALIASGVILEKSSIGNGFGYEGAGLVVGAAEGSQFGPGDRVMVSASGSLATRTTVDERLCARIPDSMSFEDAASMPAVYCTAVYSLITAGRLRKGESVLIHAASGGVGIAALHIAKMIGAEIYCTVGSEHKVAFLKENFGIPADHIFHSRNSSFLPAILAATHGRGVDVVLNSLSGELLHASWKCVAEFGRFVEIGRRDFIGQGKLDMAAFEGNRSFTGFDLLAVSMKQPQMIQDLMTMTMGFYGQSLVKPIRPIHIHDATNILDPFRVLQKAAHIGKLVVSLPDDHTVLKSESGKAELKFRADRAYLFVGGLGGIGKAMCSWLVEKGARHIIVLSRSAGNATDDHPVIQELHAMGCQVKGVSGDVTKYDDVVRAIKSSELPIGGVFQASMVLKDGNFVEMDWEQWQIAVLPKVKGTWNLHNALLQQEEPLDHFFLFSSAGAVSGQWGQSNYNAGNTFLDAFAQYRQSLGLPASVMNIGVIEDVGYVNDNPAVLDSLRATTQYLVREPDLLNSVELMLQRSNPSNVTKITDQPAPDFRISRFVNHAQVAIGMRSTIPITADANRTIWRKDPRMLVYRNIEAGSSSGGAGDGSSDAAFKAFIKDVSTNLTLLKSPDTAVKLATEIGRTLFKFLAQGDEFDPESQLEMDLANVGIDSLISIEVRNWIRKTIGVDLTVLEIVKSECMKAMGEKAQAKLVAKVEATL